MVGAQPWWVAFTDFVGFSKRARAGPTLLITDTPPSKTFQIGFFFVFSLDCFTLAILFILLYSTLRIGGVCLLATHCIHATSSVKNRPVACLKGEPTDSLTAS